jgi:hypothetical protein
LDAGTSGDALAEVEGADAEPVRIEPVRTKGGIRSAAAEVSWQRLWRQPHHLMPAFPWPLFFTALYSLDPGGAPPPGN